MPNRFIHSNDNPELTQERERCKFDTDILSARIYGSFNAVSEKRRIRKDIESIPELANAKTDLDIVFMTRLEKFENSYKNSVLAEKYIDQVIDRNNPEQYEYYQTLINGTSGNPFALKHIIVIPLLENSADDEQRKLFLEPAKRHEFCSAYAQTELGHGTNTKKLETTATYDPKTQEFVLNSPTISSFKWWPGNLGKVASMVVVMADLRINNTSYGMHPFFVRIRDETTHKLLPNVEAGDIGPTHADYVNDNGYLGFKNFRVPRNSMLSKHFKVHPNGEYEMAIHPRLAYTGMMFVRSKMIFDCGIGLAAASIIAIRYSLIRRQGEIENGKGEVKILDYKTQQYRVLPQLARALCFCFAGHFTMNLYKKVMSDVKDGNASEMASLHAITSGLKSVCSYQMSIGVEQCRLSCGGHGYSLASGLPQWLSKSVAGCTYEGDNLVMLLQLSRYLMKCAKDVRSGKKWNMHDKLIEYIYEKNESRFNLTSASTKYQKWSQFQAAFEHLSRRLTLKAYDRFAFHITKDPRPIAWNKTSVELIKASKAHTRTFLSRNFIQTVQNEQDQRVKEVLSDILDLYLQYELFECRADLLEDNYINGAHLDQIRDELNKSLSRVRQNALNIADSFDIPDRILCSVLGRRDGHIWENLMKWAERSELNKTSVLPFHHQTLGKLMRDQQLNSKL